VRPVFPYMRAIGMKQPRIPLRLVAQEQQPFAIRIESADWIHIFWKAEFGECTPLAPWLGSELR